MCIVRLCKEVRLILILLIRGTLIKKKVVLGVSYYGTRRYTGSVPVHHREFLPVDSRCCYRPVPACSVTLGSCRRFNGGAPGARTWRKREVVPERSRRRRRTFPAVRKLANKPRTVGHRYRADWSFRWFAPVKRTPADSLSGTFDVFLRVVVIPPRALCSPRLRFPW